MTDYYDARTGKNLGFRARPVVGGFFARVLLASRGVLARTGTSRGGVAESNKREEVLYA